eukprot:tig00001229_g7835.t1
MLVVTFTGDKLGAGTSANVFLSVNGSNGILKKVPLESEVTGKEREDLFDRAGVDSFDIVSGDLGDIESISLEHDNRGFGSGWFLDRVVIKAYSLPATRPPTPTAPLEGAGAGEAEGGRESPAPEHEWSFLCGRWLATDEDDGSLVRELHPVNAVVERASVEDGGATLQRRPPGAPRPALHLSAHGASVQIVGRPVGGAAFAVLRVAVVECTGLRCGPMGGAVEVSVALTLHGVEAQTGVAAATGTDAAHLNEEFYLPLVEPRGCLLVRVLEHGEAGAEGEVAGCARVPLCDELLDGRPRDRLYELRARRWAFTPLYATEGPEGGRRRGKEREGRGRVRLELQLLLASWPAFLKNHLLPYFPDPSGEAPRAEEFSWDEFKANVERSAAVIALFRPAFDFAEGVLAWRSPLLTVASLIVSAALAFHIHLAPALLVLYLAIAIATPPLQARAAERRAKAAARAAAAARPRARGGASRGGVAGGEAAAALAAGAGDGAEQRRGGRLLRIRLRLVRLPPRRLRRLRRPPGREGRKAGAPGARAGRGKKKGGRGAGAGAGRSKSGSSASSSGGSSSSREGLVERFERVRARMFEIQRGMDAVCTLVERCQALGSPASPARSALAVAALLLLFLLLVLLPGRWLALAAIAVVYTVHFRPEESPLSAFFRRLPDRRPALPASPFTELHPEPAPVLRRPSAPPRAPRSESFRVPRPAPNPRSASFSARSLAP